MTELDGKAVLTFQDAGSFRLWLEGQGAEAQGVWLRFGKMGGPKTLKASEALEEALCCGWIDGQMKRLDDTAYLKYFAPRVKGSVWSEKNKKLVAQLEEEGRMTELGRDAVRKAKEGGSWDAPKPPSVGEEHIKSVLELLQGTEPARSNFESMSPSVKRTYARAYFDAKTEAGREKRLAWMIDRLNRNLKPM